MSAYQFGLKFDQTVQHIGDDFADRLSYRYTVVLLVTCSFITTSKMYIADPISCWVPKHFSGDHGHEQYTNDYCWIASTYYSPFEEEVPLSHETDKRHVVRYYQWVPIMLAVQALLFYVPIILWNEMSRRSGINVEKLVKLSKVLGAGDTEDEEVVGSTTHIVNVINKVLTSRQMLKGRLFPIPCGREKGNFLFPRYLLVKLFFLTNVIGQFLLLSTFLDCNFPAFGVELLHSMVRGDPWEGFRRFPRVTMCDLQIRRLANIHQYTVQCVLIINLFTEKIYLLLWFWFIGVFIVTAATAVKWAMFLFRGPRVQYLKMLMGERDSNNGPTLADFTTDYLCHDGFFAMKLIEENVGPVVTTDLLRALYKKFENPHASESKGKKPFTGQAQANQSYGTTMSAQTHYDSKQSTGANIVELTEVKESPATSMSTKAQVLPSPVSPSAPLASLETDALITHHADN